jgi:hypothetical protein
MLKGIEVISMLPKLCYRDKAVCKFRNIPYIINPLKEDLATNLSTDTQGSSASTFDKMFTRNSDIYILSVGFEVMQVLPYICEVMGCTTIHVPFGSKGLVTVNADALPTAPNTSEGGAPAWLGTDGRKGIECSPVGRSS